MDNFREFRLTAILSGAELAGGEAKKKKRRRKEGEKKERGHKAALSFVLSSRTVSF